MILAVILGCHDEHSCLQRGAMTDWCVVRVVLPCVCTFVLCWSVSFAACGERILNRCFRNCFRNGNVVRTT